MSQPFDPNQPPPPPSRRAQPPCRRSSRPQPAGVGSEPQNAPSRRSRSRMPLAHRRPTRRLPAVNPYGGGGQAWPGSKAYVEQNFGPVAGFGSRAGALIIDTLLTLIGLIPFIIGTVLLVVAAPETDELGYSVDGTADGGLAATGGMLMALGVLLMIGIQVWNRIFKMGRTGQSVGKKVLGPQARQRADRPADRGDAVVPARAARRPHQPDLLPELPLDALGRQQADPRRQGRPLDRHRGPQVLTPSSDYCRTCSAAAPRLHRGGNECDARRRGQAGESQVQPGTLRAPRTP